MAEDCLAAVLLDVVDGAPPVRTPEAYAALRGSAADQTAEVRAVLDAGAPRSDWHAGQYVSIDPHQFPGLRSLVDYLEHVKGRREVARAYSMCSAPRPARRPRIRA